MAEEASVMEKEKPRLNQEQQTEIEDIFRSARTVSREMIIEARQQSDEILRTARDRAEQIIEAAEDQAAETLRAAEERAAAILREAEEKAAAAPQEAGEDAAQGPVMSAQMQEYVVQYVGDCFEKLRRQQLEAAELVNEQWRGFLSGLQLSEETAAPRRRAGGEEISRQDIEQRVSVIARELMEIIGK